VKDDYLACYDVLEMQPGCSWTQLRGAYRRLVRTWHPDHFHQEPEKKALAEEKIKEINQAYERLSGYRHAYGHLPMPATVQQPGEPQSVRDGAKPQEPPPSDARPAAAEYMADWTSHRPADKTAKPFHIMRLLWVGLAVWGAYTYWSSLKPSPDSTTDQASRSPGAVTAIDNAGNSATSQPEQPIGPGFFTVGSTRTEVQAVQGIPTKIENGVWYYGKSKVYFIKGVVLRWDSDPSSPLKIDLESSSPAPASITFTVGSTAAEVRSIQGIPLLETDSEWDYGVSKVYFSRKRVIGWYSSPLSPLKVSNR